MRALEITIFLIMVLTAPSVIQAMGVVPTATNTCQVTECQASKTIYEMAAGFQLQAVNFDSGPIQLAGDLVLFSLTLPLYALFWMLYFLSVITFVRPAMISMFGVPEVMATYLQLGIWILWLLAYVQWKRGGLGTDAAR